MKNAILPLGFIFSGSLLTGVTNLENSSANAQTSPHQVFRDFQREHYIKKKTPRIPKDVLIVDFTTSSRQLQDACTDAVTQPVTRQKKGFAGNAKGFVKYDIDQNGLIQNKSVLGGQWHVTEAALLGLANTVFRPPVHDGQRLYCKNVKESLEWYSPGTTRWVAIRSRANYQQFVEFSGW